MIYHLGVHEGMGEVKKDHCFFPFGLAWLRTIIISREHARPNISLELSPPLLMQDAFVSYAGELA